MPGSSNRFTPTLSMCRQVPSLCRSRNVRLHGHAGLLRVPSRNSALNVGRSSSCTQRKTFEADDLGDREPQHHCGRGIRVQHRSGFVYERDRVGAVLDESSGELRGLPRACEDSCPGVESYRSFGDLPVQGGNSRAACDARRHSQADDTADDGASGGQRYLSVRAAAPTRSLPGRGVFEEGVLRQGGRGQESVSGDGGTHAALDTSD